MIKKIKHDINKHSSLFLLKKTMFHNSTGLYNKAFYVSRVFADVSHFHTSLLASMRANY